MKWRSGAPDERCARERAKLATNTYVPWGAYAKRYAPVTRLGVTRNSLRARVNHTVLNVAMQDLTPLIR